MRVLWILHNPLPEALSALTGRDEVSRTTGSWICGLSEALSGRPDVRLFTVAPSRLTRKLLEIKGEKITHFILPAGSSDWKEVRDRVNPDVVHIHGSEYPLAHEYVRTCGGAHVVVSLQGLVSVYRDYYYGGIPENVVRRYVSLRDVVRRDSLISQKADMQRRGECEISLLKSVDHVMGRTSWDRRESLAVHPGLHYHYCGEALREPFYSGCWRFSSCVPHRIFAAQGYYPIKGAHKLLEALPGVLDRCPDTTVHIAGPDPLRGPGLKNRMLRNGYGCYLSDLIRKYGLGNVVTFIGPSDAETIKRELLEANVSVLPSIIENSPNALCEAQMLGVPCIASDVGGTSSLVPDPSCGELYPFEDVEALMGRILSVFKTSPGFDNGAMRAVAAARHDRQTILNDLMKTYVEVAG